MVHVLASESGMRAAGRPRSPTLPGPTSLALLLARAAARRRPAAQWRALAATAAGPSWQGLGQGNSAIQVRQCQSLADVLRARLIIM